MNKRKMFCKRLYSSCLKPPPRHRFLHTFLHLGSVLLQPGRERCITDLSRKNTWSLTAKWKLKHYLNKDCSIKESCVLKDKHSDKHQSFKVAQHQSRSCIHSHYIKNCTPTRHFFSRPAFSVRLYSTYNQNNSAVGSETKLGTPADVGEIDKQTEDNCYRWESAEDLLQFLDSKLHGKSLTESKVLANIASQFQILVHAKLSVPYMSTKMHFQKKWIEIISADMDIINKFRSDSRWKQFMSFTSSQVEDLSLKDQLVILNCLSSLLISRENELFDRLLQNCLSNANSLDLQDLKVLSNIVCEFERDFVTQGCVAAAIHDRLLSSEIKDIHISDLCDALLNLKPVLGADSLELVAEVVKKKLDQDSPCVTAGDLIRVYQLSVACGESTLLQDLPLDTLHGWTNDQMMQDLPVRGLDLAAITEHPWPISHLLGRVTQLCLARLSNVPAGMDKDAPIFLSYCVQALSSDVLLPFIRDADIFWLIQMLGLHLMSDLESRPEILQAYHTRLAELIPGLDQTQVDCLLAFNGGRFAQVLVYFNKCLSDSRIQPDADVKTKMGRSSTLGLRQACWDTPPLLAQVVVKEAVDKLSADFLLSHGDLSILTLLTSRLDLESSLVIYEELDSLITSPQRSSQLKRQVQRLRAGVQAQFLDRLGRSHDLPSTLTPGIRLGKEQDLSVLRQRGRPGLYEDLLESLGRFCDSGCRRKSNHIGALAVLDSVGETWPYYQEELLEHLTNFVVNECPRSLTLGLRLLKTLACAGYLPLDGEVFTSWVWDLLADVMELRAVDPSLQVQLASSLSVLGIYHDGFLCNIFNMDFITNLQQELKGKPPGYRERAVQDLVLLSRSVAIECPHLSVACLDSCNGPHHKLPRQDRFNVQRMVASLSRVCWDDRCVTADTRSPYGHHIDALLTLDSNFLPVSASELDQTQECQRLAFLYGSEHHFCLGQDGRLTGPSQASVRQLQMLGYNVVLVQHFELSSMEMHSEEAMDELVREKINKAVGSEVFTSKCWDQE